MRRTVLTAAWICSVLGTPAWAQDGRRVFAGGLFGVSALSADGRAIASPPAADVSLYDPANGPALNLFAGVHLAEYVSVQGTYVWNRNDLVLVAASATAGGGASYEQRRSSAQHAAVADVLVYFRRRDSRVRPYLGTGLAAVRFSSAETGIVAAGLEPPAQEIVTTRLALRSHVGIDVAVTSRLRFRYSFSETIGPNPISPHLRPRGERALMNFQNLFGLVTTF